MWIIAIFAIVASEEKNLIYIIFDFKLIQYYEWISIFLNNIILILIKFSQNIWVFRKGSTTRAQQVHNLPDAKALSAYNVFMKGEVAKVKQEHPELPHREALMAQHALKSYI